MFHGQPYCDACGYEGPDFMWTWHHFMGYRVLVQNQASLELRTIKVPDDEVFYNRAGRSEADRARKRVAYVAAVIASGLRPGERHVPPEEFAPANPFESEDAAPHRTALVCPACRSHLLWRYTGIS